MGISRPNIIIRARMRSVTGMGEEMQSQTKLPTPMLFMSTPCTLMVHASPAKHCCMDTPASSLNAFTTPVSFAGTTTTRSPSFSVPDSILPDNATDEPDVCIDRNTSETEKRNGLSKARSLACSRLMQSIKVEPAFGSLIKKRV